MTKFTWLALLCWASTAIAQTPPLQLLENWQQIALINEVWYKDGSRYVHPSFEYAGTGFLIDTGTDTLAVTAKHLLWVAQPKQLENVAINGQVEKWWLHPKGDTTVGVFLDQLLNEDPEEALGGPNSTIGQRDWLVFSLKEKQGNLPALPVRYTQVEVGEKLYYPACPYRQEACILGEAKVLSALGNRIVFTKEVEGFIGGASGSPLVDSQGRLVGVLGGMSVDPNTGEPALYGISTHYLRNVLNQAPHLNQALTPIGEVLWPIINAHGIGPALSHWRKLREDEMSHFYLDLLPESFNTVGQTLLELGRGEEAITWFEASIEEDPWLAASHRFLAEAYAQEGKLKKARQLLQALLTKWPQDEAAKKSLEKLQP